MYIWQPNPRMLGDWRGMFVECLFIYLLIFTGLSTTDKANRPTVNLPSKNIIYIYIGLRVA